MESAHPGLQLGGRYTLRERRASGATATVWLAADDFLERRVAVKILHPHLSDDRELAGRFAQEARAAAMVSHRGLVAVYDTIKGPPPAIVMEWVEGIDLRQRLDEGPLTGPEAQALGADLCAALGALHEAGLVHRDIKPANVLLTPDARPKLADFGIATANAGDRTATGIVLGTAKYLSPEQVRGDRIDQRTDVYALAAVLYESLTGQAPFVRDGDLATALARLEGDPLDPRSLVPAIPEPLARAVMGGLERDPAHRWPHVAAFDEALTAPATIPLPATTAPLPRPPAPPSPQVVHPPPRRWWPRLVGVGLFLAIGGLGWLLIAPDQQSPRSPAPSVQPVGVTAFDPEGTGTPGEHDDLALLALDGDRETSWPTERYVARDLGAKSGVGLVVELAQISPIGSITIETDATGWAVQIAVADAAGTSRADYGPPVAEGVDLSSVAEFDIAASGRFALIWFTDLGEGELPVQIRIREITVR